VLLALVSVAIYAGIKIFGSSRVEQIDYSHREGSLEVIIPLIGPYEATGFGDPLDGWRPEEFELEEIPADSRIVVKGEIEVTGGDSAPLTVRLVMTKANQNDLMRNISLDSENLIFSKPRTIEQRGRYSIATRTPVKPGVYKFHIAHPNIHEPNPIVYARAKVRIVEK
jgi:hypothetical protein